MDGTLHIYDDTWELHEDGCPCDLHFLDFLADRGIANATIFHMGTGAHHVVGQRSAESGSGNAVLGITASPGEYERYVKLAIERPKVVGSYKAFFGDIYQLDARLLPPLDVATLFHLCEFRTERNDAYGAMTDLEVARLLWDKLKPGGRMLFYRKSMSYDKAIPNIAALQQQREMVPEPDFKTLQVFRKPAAKAAKRPTAKTKTKTKTRTRANARKPPAGKKRR